MKTFTVAILMLAALTVGVFWNANRVTDTIYNYIEEIESLSIPRPGDDLSVHMMTVFRIQEEWSEDAKWMSLTVNHADLMTVEEKLSATLGATRSNSVSDYLTAREQLLYAMEHLSDMAEFSLGNIF